ncbi:MAG: T9SS type A sorting domain-containing protein [Hyphomicrobiales bacterium]
MKLTHYSVRLVAVLVATLMFSYQGYSQDHNVGGGAHGITKSPSLVNYQNNLWAFYQGRYGNRKLEFRILKDGEWNLQSRVPGLEMTESPSAVVFNNKIYVYHQDNDHRGQLYCISYDGENWSKDTRIYDRALSFSPSAVSYHGKMYIFHRASKGRRELWYSTFDGNNWSKDEKPPVKSTVLATESPAAVVYKDKIYVFHKSGVNDNPELWYFTFDGNTWSEDRRVDNVMLLGSPAVTVYKDKIYLAHLGHSNTEEMYYTTFDGNTFTTDARINGPECGWTPGIGVYGDVLYNLFEYKQGKGYLWYIKNQDNKWGHAQIIDGFSFSRDGYMDKKFGTFTFPSTHNSFIAGSLFISGNNSHDELVPYQLAQGIRFIELDINKIPFPFNANIEHSIAIEHGKIYGGTIFGQRNVRFGLEEITDFLKANPEELIILKLDSPSGVPYDELKYFFTKYGIYDRLYMGPRKDFQNMTPRDIIKTGKQILLIGGDTREMASGIEGLMNNSRTWGSADINNMNPVCQNTDVISKPLYIPAMYGVTSNLGFGSKDRAAVINEYDWAKDYFLTGWRGSALRPTSFVWDYSTYGDVFEVIYEMNNYYNSVRGTAKDAAGNYLNNVQYTVSYSSDGKTVNAVARGKFDFPARQNETVTITPHLDGIVFSPAFYTYSNSSKSDAEVDFVGTPTQQLKSMKADSEEALGYGFNVYPNPMSNQMNISVQNENPANGKLEVFDISGKSVLTQELGVVEKGNHELNINTSSLGQGAYVYRFTLGDKTFNGEMIKR